MAVNKIIAFNETLIDLTGDTVIPSVLKSGYSAHDKTGEQIVGTHSGLDKLEEIIGSCTSEAITIVDGTISDSITVVLQDSSGNNIFDNSGEIVNAALTLVIK